MFTISYYVLVLPLEDNPSGAEQPYDSDAHQSFTSCGMDILPSAGNSGLISSPNYPLPYPPKSHCFWNFTNDDPDRLKLFLRIVDIDIETDAGSECTYDKLTIRQAGVDEILCGQRNGTIDVSEETVLIVFTSDHVVEGSGFKIRYAFMLK